MWTGIMQQGQHFTRSQCTTDSNNSWDLQICKVDGLNLGNGYVTILGKNKQATKRH